MKKMTKKDKIVIVIIVIFTILATSFGKSLFVPCIVFMQASIWHLTKNHTVVCGNASLSLNMPWFPVIDVYGQISLTRVPNIGSGFNGLVEILNRKYDTSTIQKQMAIKSIGDKSVVAEGNKTFQICGKTSYSVRYHYTKKELQGLYFEYIGIPESKICISITDVPLRDTAAVNKLIGSIQLK